MTPALDYATAWKFLDQLQFFKIKLGLESMEAFLADLGQPQRRFVSVHIAGTNGKGSTAAFLVAVLRQAGYHVGLYSSPHLESVRERFQIDGVPVSRETFAQEAARIIEILGGRQITYFEFTTALAFLWFAARQVDIAVVETGLGGRLDATNVLAPALSIITNVSFDHQQYLGTTIAEIAAEKAGIIKPGVPVVSGVEDAAALAMIKRVAREKAAPLFLLGRDFQATAAVSPSKGWSYEGIRLPGASGRRCCPDLQPALLGRHQFANGALALAAAELLSDRGFVIGTEPMRAGINRARWPGRLELFGIERGGEKKRILIDGAHNPAGARALVAALEDLFPCRRLVLVWAAMADKDLAQTLLPVAARAQAIFFTALPYERAATPETLQDILTVADRQKSARAGTMEQALEAALASCGKDDLLLVAGSLYLVGAARARIIRLGAWPEAEGGQSWPT